MMLLDLFYNCASCCTIADAGMLEGHTDQQRQSDAIAATPWPVCGPCIATGALQCHAYHVTSACNI